MEEISLQKKDDDAFYVSLLVKGKSQKTLDALIDSGARSSYVANNICIDKGLRFVGSRSGGTCIHGKIHENLKVPVYKGNIEIGTFSKEIDVIGLSDDITVGSEKVDAIIGRNILQNFTVNLDWKNCKGDMK